MTPKEQTLADLLLDKAIKWTSDAVFNENDRAAVENVVAIYGNLIGASNVRGYSEVHPFLGRGFAPGPEDECVPDAAPQEAKPAKATSRKKEKPPVTAEVTIPETVVVTEADSPAAAEAVSGLEIVGTETTAETPPVTEETVIAAAEEVLLESTPIELKDLTDIYWKWHGKYSTADTGKWLILKKRMEEIRDSFGAASLAAIKPENLSAAHALFADIQDPA